MKTKFFMLLLLTLVSFALPYDDCDFYKTADDTEETFMEEIIGLVRPLMILGIFFVPPILIVAVIMFIFAAGKKGVELTVDLFKNDEEEENERS